MRPVTRRVRSPGPHRAIGLCCLLALCWGPVPPAAGKAAPDGDDADLRWRQVIDHRAVGEYAAAADIIRSILADYAESEEIQRLAHNQLVFTHYAGADTAAMETAARSALAQYPDLRAPLSDFPPPVQRLYDQLRAQMFGAVEFVGAKEGQVFLDGELKGQIPLQLALLPVGRYDLTVVKPGFHDYQDTIEVAAGVEKSFSISMGRKAGLKSWLLKAGPLVVLGTIIGVTSGGGDDAGPEPLTRLSDPPAPPD